MTELLLEDLFVWQMKLNRQKEEFSRSLSQIITPRLSYSLVQILFFIDNDYCKRFLEDALDKKVETKTGSWYKSYYWFGHIENKHIEEAKINSC